MTQAFTPGLRIIPFTTVRKERELAVAGEILVSPGDRVKAEQVIGRAELQGELLILRLAEHLGIGAEEAVEGLKVEKGQSVKLGQVICEHAGLFGLLKSRYTSPRDGQIEFITERTGHVGLRLPSRPIELSAYITGTVVATLPGRSVTIESLSSIVQGIFGVGGERHGILQQIAGPADELSHTMLSDDLKGKIIFGGRRASGDILKLACEKGALGFITGSLDDTALRGYLGYDLGLALTGNEDIPMSVIITEGFGDIAMSAKSHKLLSELQGLPASINGATQVRAGAIRPEIIVSRDDEKENVSVQDELSGLQVGTRIRLIRVPYFGMRGEIIELPFEQTKIETGAYTRVLKARLDDGREVIVPRANVEL